MPDNINLFALVDDEQAPIRRIPLTADLGAELTQFITQQQSVFLNNKQQIPFSGSYNVESGEIFTIAQYPLPDVISSALSNPLPCQMLNLNNETHRIKALFTGIWSNANKTVSFQVFDTGKLLTKGWTLIGSGNNYKKLEEPGLILQDKLTAHYANGTLYFSSYHNTKRFLDLSDYYREATDTDLDTFTEVELFIFEDQESFKKNADSVIRKKVALLQKNKVLEKLTVTDIQDVAKNFNEGLSAEHQINLRVSEDGKLIVPQDKKQLKELIRFLDEEYFTAPLTKRKCLTNSKQYL